jgi:UDP-N-acetylglucosamine 2-epimerase (non-hydrolysing)
MTKVLTILGTRPEIIRLSCIIPKLDAACDHYVLHTGQNYDNNLNELFFQELELRKPNKIIDSKSQSFGEQLGKIFIGVEQAINEFNPTKVLVLGDTNSGLSAFIVERFNIPVYHMEAGNRCNDLKVPEEKNRKVIDAISTYNLPYTELSRQNLLREGVPNNKIAVTGNPIKEVINKYQNKISQSSILAKLNLQPKDYVIVTAHRAENVDDDSRLKSIFAALQEIAKEYKVVFSCHPRTRDKIQKFNVNTDNIIVSEPFGFFDFVNLEQNCFMAISDSGTVQEEMCLFKIPTVTIRDTTERPETVWCGSNVISGLDKTNIVACFNRMKLSNRNWEVPVEYDRDNVSDVVVNILLSTQG